MNEASGPIVRLVKLSIRRNAVSEFDALFEAHRTAIAGFPGCLSLMLLNDGVAGGEGVLRATLSHWESVEALNAYRASALFGVIWPQTKALFAAPPVVETFAELTRGKV
jgi:quinol monooxygenase YgiN